MSDLATTHTSKEIQAMAEKALDNTQGYIDGLIGVVSMLFAVTGNRMLDDGLDGREINAALTTAAADIYAREFVMSMQSGDEIQAFDNCIPQLRAMVEVYVAAKKAKKLDELANVSEQGNA